LQLDTVERELLLTISLVVAVVVGIVLGLPLVLDLAAAAFR
jgi:hypothetical protein